MTLTYRMCNNCVVREVFPVNFPVKLYDSGQLETECHKALLCSKLRSIATTILQSLAVTYTHLK